MNIYVKRYLTIVLAVMLVGIYASSIIAIADWNKWLGVAVFVLTLPGIFLASASDSTLNKWGIE